MKTLIAAINSKYIHSCLAAWYLKASCDEGCGNVIVREYTINQRHDDIFHALYLEKTDVIAFSCYIWNIGQVLALTADIKKAAPDTKVILGGPEVSFDCDKIMHENPGVDFIIRGEGETAFNRLLKYLNSSIKQNKYEGYIKGLCFREEGRIVESPCYNIIKELDAIKSPYTDDMLCHVRDKIVYFESSRGCPFSCAYCLSSIYKGVRYFSIDRVRDELQKLINEGVKQVKFVDRTFNCSRDRAMEIIRFVVESGNGVNFHFEICADLLDDEITDLLAKAPDGLIQLEIGVQSLNEDSLLAVNRKTNIERLFYYVRKLRKAGNVHIHLDLIVGLPYEDYISFKASFNGVFSLKPHYLQLGFLKLLKGTLIRDAAAEHGYVFRELPPYEIISGSYISFDEILIFKGVENMIDMYYNTSGFAKSLNYAIYKYNSTPFDFFFDLHKYASAGKSSDRATGLKEKYLVLKAFFNNMFSADDIVILEELLKFDYFSSNSSKTLPEGFGRVSFTELNNFCFDFLSDENNIKEYLPGLYGHAPKQIIKKIHIEVFRFNVLADKTDYDTSGTRIAVLFDHTCKNPVTGLYKSHLVKHV
jgi:radical SAM superfamily enzyme YgiQ (UPF0313 family)